jgi:hypothetical protein
MVAKAVVHGSDVEVVTADVEVNLLADEREARAELEEGVA